MSATDEGFTNQRQTEPMPATPPHDVPDTAPGDQPPRPPAEAGNVRDVGARESDQPRGTNDRPQSPVSAGQPAGDMANSPDVDAGAEHGPHDAGRPAGETLGTAHRQPGSMGTSPDPYDVDTGEGARRTQDAIHSNDTRDPGDPRSSPAPSYLAAEGTSEQAGPVDGVRITSIAQPGKADGETDTRM